MVFTSFIRKGYQLTKSEVRITINTLFQLILFAPIRFCLGNLYNRYIAYHAVVLQRQVEMLEKLWQQSTYSEEIIL